MAGNRALSARFHDQPAAGEELGLKGNHQRVRARLRHGRKHLTILRFFERRLEWWADERDLDPLGRLSHRRAFWPVPHAVRREIRHPRRRGNNLPHEFETLARDLRAGIDRRAADVPTRPRQAGHDPICDRVRAN
jgi:hypothetical protein